MLKWMLHNILRYLNFEYLIAVQIRKKKSYATSYTLNFLTLYFSNTIIRKVHYPHHSNDSKEPILWSKSLMPLYLMSWFVKKNQLILWIRFVYHKTCKHVIFWYRTDSILLYSVFAIKHQCFKKFDITRSIVDIFPIDGKLQFFYPLLSKCYDIFYCQLVFCSLSL